MPQAGSQIVSPGSGAHAVHHRLDQRARREVLAGAALDVLRVLLQQPLVGVALDVGVERASSSPCRSGRRSRAAAWPGPGILFCALRKISAEHARLVAQRFQHVAVVVSSSSPSRASSAGQA